MRNIKTLPDIIKFYATIGNLPTSYMESLTYEEQLLWLLNFLNKTILPTMHETINSVEELENWFNNLDVQEEINNKLDAMAESGELEEIISEYLNSQALFGYNTVQDMKEATNLINGSYAKTLGYYSKNDGGSATYKIRNITNEDTVDEMTILSMNNEELVAELIIEYPINPKKLGAYYDNEHDDSSYINKALSLGNVILNKANIKCNETLIIGSNTEFDLGKATIYSSADITIKMNTISSESAYKNSIIKNGTIRTTNNGIQIINSYYIKLIDLEIVTTSASGICVEFINGFNNDVIRCLLHGTDEQHGLNGIKYSFNTSASISGITNITNINIDSCLIQRLSKGILIEGGSGGSYDTNKITNTSFSYIDTVGIDMDSANTGNWDIDTARIEASTRFLDLSNTCFVNISNLYLLNTNGINNKSNIIITGNCCINKTDNTVRYLLLSNTGNVRFSGANVRLLNNNLICDNTVKVTNIISDTKFHIPVNTNVTNFLPQFINIKYTGTQTINVSDIIAPEGAEMYILRRTDDYGWLLPDGVTYTQAGKLYHLLKTNGTWICIE